MLDALVAASSKAGELPFISSSLSAA